MSSKILDLDNPIPSILVIDDDPRNLAIVTDFLGGCNYTILVAQDGESGIKRAAYALPDLILLDVLMPGIDGFETCRRLKSMEVTKGIPVIFTTALAEIEYKIKGFKAGGVDYIIKPFQREEVLARVGVHLKIQNLTSKLHIANESLEKKVIERTVALEVTNMELQKEIVERKLAEERLAVKRDKLEYLNKNLERRISEEVDKNLQKDRILFHQARLAAMGEMLSNIAHQWRQPLNNIGLMLQYSLLEYKNGELEEESFTTSIDSCLEMLNYLSNTISVFQNFFRPQRDCLEFNPSDMLDKSVSLVRASYDQGGIKLRVVNHGTQPMSGYDMEFSQAILNILNNAKDVLNERHIAEPAVDISCSSEGNLNIFKFRDNAGGIPEEILDKIFDPYFTTKFKSQGTGIGLYMSKMIIEKNMGGKIMVRNTPEGAEFTIELPLIPEQSAS